MSTQLDPLSIAADLLYEVTTGGDVAALRDHLATLEHDRLARALSGRRRRLCFWLNCYNAYAQLLLEEAPSVLEGGFLERFKFYARDRIPVAGVWLSLADVRHGMLRGSKHPWGFGYLPRPFPSSFEREFRLESVDPRIHFAIGSGTENGPPIAVYTPDDCEAELDVATEWYLEENVSHDPDRGVVTVPRRFLRYHGDFRVEGGVVPFLRSHGVVPADATPALEYEKTNRSVDVNEYRG